MEFISVREAAEKWGISIRRVQYLCSHDMIPGVIRFGKTWAIPKGEAKPKDRRKKNEENQNRISQSLKPLFGNEDLRFVESCPFPIQVFTPDGAVIMTNKAFLDVFKIPSKDVLNGKYNILRDPGIETWGIKEYVLRAFQGELIHIYDIKVPAKDLTARFSEKELESTSLFQNITCFPIYNDNNRLSYVVVIFITSRTYRDREEIMKSREYIESHWLEKFDIDKTAGAVNLSKYHFTRLFKKHTGMTPYGYYRDIKISRLKAKLCDPSLSVSQAFADCGLHYNGNFAKVFKEKVGMTPSQYRKRETVPTSPAPQA